MALLINVLFIWRMEMLKTLNKSIFAGIAIGLGCWLFLTIEHPILAPLLFSCGLLTVRIYKLNLFTGKTQYLWEHQLSLKNYLTILFGNLIGITLIALCSGLIGIEKVQIIAQNKAAQSIITSLSKGIGCGMLMSLATYPTSPLWLSSGCVLAFILAGFNHCIADFFYLLAGQQFTINWIFTVIGNIIGGLLFTKLNPLIKDEQ